MFRIGTAKILKCNLSGNYRILGRKLNSSSKQHAKDKPDFCPPEPKKNVGLTGGWYTVGAIVLIGGGTLCYAKYDPDFRKTITEQAPFTDTIIKFVFREEEGSSILDIYENIKSSIFKLFDSDDTPKKKSREAIIEKSVDYKPPKSAFSTVAKTAKSPEENYTEIRLESKTDGSDEPHVEIAGTPKDVDAISAQLSPKNVADLEIKVGETATLAIKGFNKALAAIKRYNQEIEDFIENSSPKANQNIWNSLQKLTEEKNETLKEADKLSNEVTKKFNNLKKMLNDPNLEAPEPIREQAKANLTKVMADISKAKSQLDKESMGSKLVDKYWTKVQAGRKAFEDELGILFPHINLQEKKLNIEEGDLDLFMLHAVSKVLFYQKEMSKMETVAAERLKSAIDAAKKNGCEILSHEQLCSELEKQKRKLEDDYSKKCLKLRVESEMELKQQLKLQTQAFQDHLADAIKTREMEMEQQFGRNFDERLTAERCKFKEQVAAMVGRLRGMDQAMRARDDAEKVAQQAQVLWGACQALYRSIRTGCPGLPWTHQLRPLLPEIQAVVKAAAENDELVKVVIAGIPEEAKTRGVYPEDALRERFLKVEKVARSLALIPKEGAHLHMYFLSYLQSLLLLKAANPIPQAELNDEKVDFSKLSTNDVLQRARYYLDRGDFAQTLRYMNLLKGAPRAVARQWMEETRILLETQQAANTLMAHASASGLMYL